MSQFQCGLDQGAGAQQSEATCIRADAVAAVKPSVLSAWLVGHVQASAYRVILLCAIPS